MDTPPAISRWLVVAAVLGGLAVVIGAFGAHGLERLSLDWPETDRARRLANWEVGARYQMYHALALAGLALYLSWRPSTLGTAAGWAFLAGIAIFSGCLYLYTWTGVRGWGRVVPFGGVLLIVGWLLWAAAVVKNK